MAAPFVSWDITLSLEAFYLYGAVVRLLTGLCKSNRKPIERVQRLGALCISPAKSVRRLLASGEFTPTVSQ